MNRNSDPMKARQEPLARLQTRMMIWLIKNFGEGVATSRVERAARVLEEAAELAQAEGVPLGQAMRITDRAYERPPGEPWQEAAGVTTTLLAWAGVTGTDLLAVADAELTRVEEIPVEDMRRKHAEKVQAGTAFAGVNVVLVLTDNEKEFNYFRNVVAPKDQLTRYIRVRDDREIFGLDRSTTKFWAYGNWQNSYEGQRLYDLLLSRFQQLERF